MAVFEEQRTIARCYPAKSVTRRIILQIGFGLDDPACCHAAAELANQDFAEQSSGQFDCVRRHAGA
jgi:hypothetical protein